MISLVMCKTRHLTSDRRTKERPHASTNAKARHIRNKVSQALTGSVPLHEDPGSFGSTESKVVREIAPATCQGPDRRTHGSKMATMGLGVIPRQVLERKKEEDFFFPRPTISFVWFSTSTPPVARCGDISFGGGGGVGGEGMSVTSDLAVSDVRTSASLVKKGESCHR